MISTVAGLALMAVPLSRAQTEPERHVIEIRNFQYHPPELTVRPGDTIVWVNRDVVPHTATDQGGTWDSGNMTREETWELTLNETGSFDYLCTYHPQMTGKVLIR